jgi:cell shape-determining protein MreC
VRGIFEGEVGVETPGDWSEGLFFKVSAAPSSEEVANALSVLQRYVGGDATTVEDGDETADALSRTASRTDPTATAATRKSVPVAATAIRGHLTEPAGEVYGVVGVVESPDGAALAAANLSGGPDLVLDGSSSTQPDLLLRHDGLDRPSPVDEFFTIHNSGIGMLNLEVEGVIFGNGSGLSEVDALALGGLGADDYATDGELAASGGPAVHWDNLSNVPADLADGDQDTTYTAGPGLVLDGGELRAVWPGTNWGRHVSTTLDSAGNVGGSSAITVGSDGLGLISYYDHTNNNLKVAHCNDVACTSATVSTIDGTGDVGAFISITVGSDGLGLIGYYDGANDDLKVAHCNDVACTSATTSTIDSAGDVGNWPSIAIGRDGLGLISHFDYTNYDLRVAHCNNIACTSATSSTIDSAGTVGEHTSITVGSDGLGLISYYDYTNGDLKVAHCDNVACSSATTSTVDSAGNVGVNTSITVGSDGLGLVSYYDWWNEDLKVAHCNDIVCSSATSTTIDSAGNVGVATSITVGSDGLGVISYYRIDTGNLKVAHCSTITCSLASSTGVDSVGWGRRDTSVTVGADGLPLVSYLDVTNQDLKVVHCSNRFCIPQVRYR